ncbi:MAG: type II toxin-antitoxin system PemK/MazF family toxin [Acidobacteriota bacterium]
MQRGEIWWATLPPPIGSQPGGRRPVLILQSDFFNRSRINTIVIAAITSNLSHANEPGNVFLPMTDTKLPRDSVLNISQMTAVNRWFLTEYIGTLPEGLMMKVEEGVKQLLDLV